VADVGDEARLHVRGAAQRLGLLLQLGVEGHHAAVGLLQLAVEPLHLGLARMELLQRPQQLLVLPLQLVRGAGAPLPLQLVPELRPPPPRAGWGRRWTISNSSQPSPSGRSSTRSINRCAGASAGPGRSVSGVCPRRGRR
jgi:hypothetical protein